MSGFTKTVKEQTTFDGDTINYEFKRLKKPTVLYIAKHAEQQEDGTYQITQEKMFDIVNSDEFNNALVESIVKFDGLKDAEGQALNFSDIIQEMYFVELVTEMVQKIMTASTVQGEMEKNSAGSLSVGSQEPTPTPAP